MAGATDSTDSLRVSESKPEPFWAGRDRGSREVQVRALRAGKNLRVLAQKCRQAGRIKALQTAGSVSPPDPGRACQAKSFLANARRDAARIDKNAVKFFLCVLSQKCDGEI